MRGGQNEVGAIGLLTICENFGVVNWWAGAALILIDASAKHIALIETAELEPRSLRQRFSVASSLSSRSIPMSLSFARSFRGLCLLCVIAISGVSGCATTPYQFGSAQRYRTSAELEARTASQQVERGQPNVSRNLFG